MKRGNNHIGFLRKAILLELLLIMLAVVINGMLATVRSTAIFGETKSREDEEEKKYIKWVEFTPTCEALRYAMEKDIETYQTKRHVEWIDLLAYTAARTGAVFDKKGLQLMKKAADQMENGEIDVKEDGKELEYFSYYREAYEAVLGGMVGVYQTQSGSLSQNDTPQEQYGLKAFSPIAKGFEYHDYDDFGSSRSFGYKRKHLGHDMMGQIGTPIIAAESGVIEALGWNRYGGWRIGIRSFDGKRYYYYAHLRQNYPYQSDLEEGSVVTAGEVIGYMGHTGYSDKENVNNIKVTHLHFGLQLIFDESQKEGNNEIWVDCYELVKFLYLNRSEVAKKEGTKEWEEQHKIVDPQVTKWEQSVQK